jgi:hypothetical protein
MELNIEVNDNDVTIDHMTIKKMSFIYNAIIDGWTIKKKNDKFIFSKKHEGKKEVYLDTYLQDFVETNIRGKNK